MKLPHIFRSAEFIGFCKEFFRIVSAIRSVLAALFILIAMGGWVFHRVEQMPFWDGQYLAFITALTIGYGDVTPDTAAGRIVSIVLGVLGMIAMGLVVGAASVALRRAVEKVKGSEER